MTLLGASNRLQITFLHLSQGAKRGSTLYSKTNSSSYRPMPVKSIKSMLKGPSVPLIEAVEGFSRWLLKTGKGGLPASTSGTTALLWGKRAKVLRIMGFKSFTPTHYLRGQQTFFQTQISRWSLPKLIMLPQLPKLKFCKTSIRKYKIKFIKK